MALTLDDVDWPIRTERLVIRRARPEDAEATFAFRSLPEVAEWVTSRPTDLDAWRRRMAEPSVAAQGLVVELDGEVVGDLMVSVRDAWAQHEVADRAVGVEAELGWTISPAQQGKGLATEAARELLRICFEDLGLRRVVAGTFDANVASWRLMERIGMRLEVHSRADALHRTRGWLDGREYALLAEEWAASAG